MQITVCESGARAGTAYESCRVLGAAVPRAVACEQDDRFTEACIAPAYQLWLVTNA